MKKLETAAGQPNTTGADLTPKPPAKSSARVNVAKSDANAATDSTGAPMQLGAGPTATTEKPAKLPTKLRPPGEEAAKAEGAAPATQAPAQTTTPAATVGGIGEWAVQLAAPRSEADAQSAIAKLQTKYSADLGGASLGVHKAEVNGETIYRVRASGYSKADAAALCAKVKASGGDCFIAKN